MITLNVLDMKCGGCKKRIETALSSAEIPHEIDLANKTVSIDESNLEKTLELLDDLGFDVK